MTAKAQDILGDASHIMKRRGVTYGDANILFENIAARFSLVLGQRITTQECARLLAELKLAWHDLGYQYGFVVDAINYLALGGALQNGKKEE